MTTSLGALGAPRLARPRAASARARGDAARRGPATLRARSVASANDFDVPSARLPLRPAASPAATHSPCSSPRFAASRVPLARAAASGDASSSAAVPPPSSSDDSSADLSSSASSADLSSASSADLAPASRTVVDLGALWRYVLSTACQASVMIYLTCWLSQGLSRSGLDPKLQTAIVFVWFLFNALRSRVFSPMDASRPKMAEERTAIRERKRPSWMPPPLAFPIIWSTIALLRAGSTAVVFGALGGTLNHPAVFAMLTHLAVGDTWNAINNVERRLGTACLGVACVLASVYAVVAKYYAVAPKAGVMIAPSAVWISVATVLVWTIWKINPGEDGEREPLLPTKEIAA